MTFHIPRAIPPPGTHPDEYEFTGGGCGAGVSARSGGGIGLYRSFDHPSRVPDHMGGGGSGRDVVAIFLGVSVQAVTSRIDIATHNAIRCIMVIAP
jgi:hypothetical protein